MVYKIKIDTKVFTDSLKKKLDAKALLRPVAFDVLSMMTERIHEEGKDANDSKIGTYNASYLKLRQKKYKRTSDPTIIVSLTRQLENDWSVLPTEKGWGIGFKNGKNYQKMRWVEANKDKKIASLTDKERSYAMQKLQKLVAQQFK